MVYSRSLNAGYWALRIAFGLGPLLAGIDKFTHFLVDWTMYLNPAVAQTLHVTPTMFMQIVGVIEIVVGLANLAGATRIFGYITMLWLFGIAANLISLGNYYDIAVRDILLGIGAYSLARVTEARMMEATTVTTEEYRRAA